jgi:hypothetical protein
MAAVKGLNVPITSSFDGKGVKQATGALGALEGIAKKLAGALSVTALAEFGRKAVEMASAQNLAFTQLDNTLKNIGLGYGVDQVTDLIAKFSEATGIAKEKLIPAFQTLAVATGSITDSQHGLQTALDVSAGTGNDLVTVSDALSKAYLGNYKALGQLNAGMTAASLKGKSMQQILAQLNQTYGGAASTAASTFAGKMQIVKNSIDEATIAIGTGLINSINNLSNNTGVDSLAGQIKGLGDSIRYTLEGYTQAVKDIANFPVVSWIGKGLNLLTLGLKEDIQAYKDLGKNSELKFSPITGARAVQTAIDTGKAERLAKEQAQQRAKAQAQITAAQAKSLALQKAQAVLSAAAQVTNLQNVEIIAAMAQSNDSNIQDRLKLQLALLDNNATAAGNLAQQILAVQQADLLVQNSDPFTGLTQGAKDALKAVTDLQAGLAQQGIAAAPTPAWAALASDAQAAIADLSLNAQVDAALSASSSSNAIPGYLQYAQGLSGGLYGSTPVQVTVVMDGQTIGGAVQQTIVNNTASGTPSTYSRSFSGW